MHNNATQRSKQMTDQIDAVEAAMEAKPTVVLQLYTHAYAQDPTPHGYSVGVRGEEGYLVEPDEAVRRDCDYLRCKYSADLHYLLDDDSVAESVWLHAADAYDAEEEQRAAEAHTFSGHAIINGVLKYGVVTGHYTNGDCDFTPDQTTPDESDEPVRIPLGCVMRAQVAN